MNKRNGWILCSMFAMMIFFGSCNSNQKTGEVKTLANFPKVEIPAMMTAQDDAVKYIVQNFWNKFLDTTRVNELLRNKRANKDINGGHLVLGLDTVKFETAFGEYAASLQYMQPKNYAAVSAAVKKLINTADDIAVSGDSSLFFRLAAYFEKYFYDPNSPVLNEEIYIPALEAIMNAKSINELDKMQYDYQLRISKLNRVGTPAADFKYSKMLSNADGKEVYGKGALYSVKADYTLVFFNNPDCPSCAEIREILKSTPAIGSLVEAGKLKILAMYIDEQLVPWRKNRGEYPNEWIYAHDPEYVLRNNDLYGLRAIPSLYLLDKEKNVLLKDATAPKVISFLNTIVQTESGPVR